MTDTQIGSGFHIDLDTIDRQRRVADPENSAWVSANAGSGKTYVLARRVIRLMLAGTHPSKILCLTFTKASASEMSNRVFDILSDWTMLDDDKLQKEIREVTGSSPNQTNLKRARQLFARALDTPGGLKIQTIHAFCEALLHQFPLEANVTGHFETLDDFGQMALMADARRDVLLSAQSGNPVLSAAYDLAMEYASDHAIDAALDEIVSKRDGFKDWMKGDVAGSIKALYLHLGFSGSETVADVEAQAMAYLDPAKTVWREAADMARNAGGKNNIILADAVDKYLMSSSDKARLSVLQPVFLKLDGSPRKSIIFGSPVKEYPHMVDWLNVQKYAVEKGQNHIKTFHALKASQAILEIGDRLLERYAVLKRARGLVDYNDMITEASNLLNRRDIKQWIQYKLDRGIDHVLIDEAQDTSPMQWGIINSVVEDFFAGDTAGKKGRTIFAVGDEKQSIYSFQGAEPAAFDSQRRGFERTVKNCGSAFQYEQLKLSFRSTKAVLSAVDAVFSIDENARGLSQSETKPVHESARINDVGEVQVWPVFHMQKVEKQDGWLASQEIEDGVDPALELAGRIAKTISTWIGQPLQGTGKPISYGDILILVRKRNRFVNSLTRTLKSEGLSIAGVDRLKLTDHIAIEDLIALGRHVLMPEDDLALAGLLKSPLFNLTEEQLFDLSYDRGGVGLLDHITAISANNAMGETAVLAATVLDQLKKYTRHTNLASAFEFYAHVLGAEGARRAFLRQMGSEVEEILDAFLEAALNHDHSEKRGLQDFLTKLEMSSPDVKRQIDMERDEIRIMTVHSAKGLEAPIVFLVDGCNEAFSGHHRSKIMTLDIPDHPPGYLWQPSTDHFVEAAKPALELQRQLAEEEYRRLLYVGMTRAADRLIVCGYCGLNKPKLPHWHSMIYAALEPNAGTIDFVGSDVKALVWPMREAEDEPGKIQLASKSSETTDVPDWLTTMPRNEYQPVPPLNPSGAGLSLAKELESKGRSSATQSRKQIADAALIGTLSHRLFQYLPDHGEGERRQIADMFLQPHTLQLGTQAVDTLINNVLATINDRSFSVIFGENCRAEVSIAGHVDLMSNGEMTRKPISGQIDRLVVTDKSVLIADFKTGQKVPDSAEHIPMEYVTQLALYRHIIGKIYPDRSIECALVWTFGPKLMPVPPTQMDAAIHALQYSSSP